ncbi:SDR family NAD(P)-dependent oxidoreductase [Paenibacillus eucommiae]|uniref:NAD(P)-dependent dehydrogenase (Short-subunit alcohol dehydrogenase family) n=1 Tax=Paenibacillus eucommiae TaxID=1355755 RepID=A0ABS4J1P0_9BACL|nr:SDR family oxidoreductase [Paenibacillus eucommiae]MBP1993703.1 NAD(P)-dependent dehydrogenase (short-subunit alcohol dehydrogenase family) [Paenibacillus eucommiae]
MSNLSGKVAIVTGGTAGIGAGIAKLFAQKGANVAIVGRNEERGRKVLQAIEGSGVKGLFVQADVGLKEDTIRYVEAALSAFGGLHIMVNNAAVIHQANVVDTEEEDWERIIRNNLTSCFLGSKYAAKAMIEQKQGGRIINVSSIHATLSEPSCSAYTAAKGGIESFTRTLATELAPHKITANILAPGATYTELTTPMYTPAVKEALFKRIPLQDIAEPEDIAHAALYLASNESRYMTGSMLTIDGGYVMDGSLPGAVYWEE